MRGERIAVVGPYPIAVEGVKALVETMHEDDQKVIATVSDPSRINELKKIKPKPTVVIVQSFPRVFDTEIAVGNTMTALPNAKIIGMGVGEIIKGAHYNIGVHEGRERLKELLLEIEH